MSEDKRPIIYYIYDALCGWCYGFSPVITEFHEKYKDEYNFQVFSGGMVTGEREGPINEVAGYIKTAYRDVEEATGIKFGEEFLQKTLADGDAYFSSVPSALAMALFRTQKPNKSIEFATRMQRAIYYEGMPPAELETYGLCAGEFNLDPILFQQKMEEKPIQELIQQEFHVVARWGIKGFPSMIYKDGDKAYMIARGYTPLPVLEETFSNVRKEIAGI